MQVYTVEDTFWDAVGELSATNRDTGETNFHRAYDAKRTLLVLDDCNTVTSPLNYIANDIRHIQNEHANFVSAAHTCSLLITFLLLSFSMFCS